MKELARHTTGIVDRFADEYLNAKLAHFCKACQL
jgi:hypothetical protein